MKGKAIMAERGPYKHSEAILWLNELIMDLKLQLAGRHPITDITPERLAEFSEHRKSLEQCVEHFEVKW